MSTLLARFEPITPTESDRQQAQELSRRLAPLRRSGQGLRLQILADQGQGPGEQLVLPDSVLQLLSTLLTEMAQGHAVTLVPIHALLTTQEAADFLNVSRPYLIGLLESGAIPYHKVGTHRRIAFRDLETYRKQIDTQRDEALKEIAELGQEFGEGY